MPRPAHQSRSIPARHRRRARAAPCSPAAFTLVEMLVALAVMAVVMGALTSAVVIGSRAVPKPGDPIAASIEAAAEVNALADDLRYATAFSAMQARAVEFTVPDRTGDSVAELLRYEWSGTAGDPLLRQMNGGAWASAIPSVTSFSLRYNTKSVTTTTQAPVIVTSPELQFSYFNGWLLVIPTYSSIAVGPTTYGAEFCTIDQVSFPADATNIRVTRVQLMLQKVATSGSLTVAVHKPAVAGSPEPLATPIGTPATVSVSSLPTSFAWFDVAMPSDVVLSKSDTELVVVVKGTVTNAAYWRMYTSTSAPKDNSPTAIWTTDGGATWNPNRSARYKNDYLFYIYGTYDTESVQDTSVTTHFMRSVGVSLQPAGAGATPVATAAPVYAQPQVNP